MKLKVRKPIWAFMILIILCTAAGYALFRLTLDVYLQQADARSTLEVESIHQTLQMIESEVDENWADMERMTKAVSDLMAAALINYIEDGVYTGPLVFEDGIVIQAAGDRILFPALVSENSDQNTFYKGIDGIRYADEHYNILEFGKDFLNSEKVLFPVVYSDDTNGSYESLISGYGTVSRIAEDLWYLDITPEEEYTDSLMDQVAILDSITDLETSYDGCLLLFEANDPAFSIAYQSDKGLEELGKLEKASDIGLTADMFDGEESVVSANGNAYLMRANPITLFGDSYYAVILLNTRDELSYIYNSVVLVFLLIFIFAAVFILWVYWLQTFVCSHGMTEAQKRYYAPSRIRGVAVSAILIGTVLLFIIALTYQSVGTLYNEVRSDQNALSQMVKRYDSDEERNMKYQAEELSWDTYFAKRVAELIAYEPKLQTKAFLNKANDLFGSEYIMFFDENGREIIASNDYVNLTLGTDICKSCAHFRRLLQGDPVTTLQAEYDQIGEKVTQLIGVRAEIPGISGYGAVLFAIDPETTWREANHRDFSNFIRTITPHGNLSFIIDRTDEVILYSNVEEYEDVEMQTLGLEVNSAESLDLDTFTVDGDVYYGPYAKVGDKIFLYLTESIYIRANTLPFALSATLCFLVINSLVGFFMLSSYRTEAYNETVRIQSSARTTQILDDSANNMWLRLQMWDEGKESLKDRWKMLVPEKKVSILIQIVSGLILIAAILMVSKPDSPAARSLIGFIIRGNWKRGINLPAFSGIALLVLGFTVFIYFKNLMLMLLDNILDPKGETISRLVFSLLQYAAIIALLFYIFAFLGLDTTALLASVSVLSFAVTLGAQGLVADILAGIFIIFEDDFRVGDIIDVNGFSGIVQEIGVRSTKIVGIGDNVKIIGNQNVKNVLNMSKMNSWYSLNVEIPSDEPLLEIEKMLERELPEIGKNIPEILSGPFYKGVMEVGDVTTLYIIAECEQEHYRRVQRDLNHAIWVLFNKYGYKFASKD